MRRLKLAAPRTVASALALALVATGGLYGCSGQGQAQGAPPPAQVTVAVPLAQRVVDWDDFTGRFEATQTAEVRARVGGYIQAVHFKDGQFVQRGQLLFTLDQRPAQAALASARASLAQAEAQAVLARANAKRSEALLASQAVSQAENDANVGALRTAEANIAAAQAAVRARELDLEYTRVTAPVSGRVSDRRVDPGNVVAGGSSAGDLLTTVVSSAPIHFVFDASEATLLKYQRQVRAGSAAPVRIRLQDENDYSRTATLDFTENAIDTASGAIRLRALVPNGDGFLKPGMFGQARVAGAASYDALLVPDAAIATDAARRVVQVVAADGSVSPRPVVLGPLIDGLRVIRSGVGPQDRVIINGALRVQMPGQKVKAVNGTITRTPTQDQTPVTYSTPAATASLASGD